MGRTGTLIAIDWLMQESRVAKEIDIFSTVLRMRECRVSMVQSEVIHFYSSMMIKYTENNLMIIIRISTNSSTSA